MPRSAWARSFGVASERRRLKAAGRLREASERNIVAMSDSETGRVPMPAVFISQPSAASGLRADHALSTPSHSEARCASGTSLEANCTAWSGSVSAQSARRYL